MFQGILGRGKNLCAPPANFVELRRMLRAPGELTSLTELHEQSVELILHARRLQHEFTQLRESSRLLRLESLQLREEVQRLRRINGNGNGHLMSEVE